MSDQKGLHKEIVAYIDEQMLNDFEGIGARKFITREKGHGRYEQRIYVQMPVPKHLAGKEKWKGLKTIGVVMLMTIRDGKGSRVCCLHQSLEFDLPTLLHYEFYFVRMLQHENTMMVCTAHLT